MALFFFWGGFRRPQIRTSPYSWWQPARFPRPACRTLRKLPSQRQRCRSAVNQLYHPRRRCGTVPREASPVTGVRGRATGALALLGASPRGIFGFFLGKQKETSHKRGIPPPANPHQLLRLVATGALSSSSLPGRPQFARPAAAARMRSQSAAPPAPALRYSSPGCVPRNGGPGESRHGGPGGWPPVRLRRPPAILWLLSHRWESNIPAKRQPNFHTISPK